MSDYQRKIKCRILFVVSYLKTTSNHNIRCALSQSCKVVSYLKTTSNHNSWTKTNANALLYLI
ncbi:hypothetical protein [uncultured Alistipes sp.]|uniref:hypothetical protein n=1 Tax=uncultured Alistipes sp. TaxID=538949 RepID=UPI0026499E15|nr:hypothetical protein [uncultured Alistipes sp.]